MDLWLIITLILVWVLCGAIGRILTRRAGENILIFMDVTCGGDPYWKTPNFMEDMGALFVGFIYLCAAPIVCYLRRR